jgi:hypothetical protein
MREREPYCAELQQSGRFRVKHTAGNVDVRHGIAVEQHLATFQIEQKRQDGGGCGQPRQQSDVGRARG